jgi:TolA-binding protein
MTEGMHGALGAALSRELADRCESAAAVANVGPAFVRGDMPRFRARHSRPSRVPRGLALAGIAAALLLFFGLRARPVATTSVGTRTAIGQEITAENAPVQHADVGLVIVPQKVSASVAPQRTAPPHPPPSKPVATHDAEAPPTSASPAKSAARTEAPPPTATPSSSADMAPNATPDQLLASADDARFSGRTDVAIALLETLRRRAPGSDQAATAAFELGKTFYDGAKSYGRAAESFDAYLRERPNGRLVREALSRAAEAHERSGDHEMARKLATSYLARFPQGPQAAIAWRIADSTYSEKAP